MEELDISYEYGYVICTLCLSWILINWLSLEVVLARDRYHVAVSTVCQIRRPSPWHLVGVLSWDLVSLLSTKDMATVLELLPPDFGLVVLVFIASIFVLQWMAIQVVRARKKFEVKYPTMYSDKEMLFNCIQRAHQNTLEGYPMFLVLLLLGGLQYPRLAAVCGVVYLISRIVYAKGYYTGEPKNRNRGAFGYLALLTLLGCNISLALTLLGFI